VFEKNLEKRNKYLAKNRRSIDFPLPTDKKPRLPPRKTKQQLDEIKSEIKKRDLASESLNNSHNRKF
jgi:hypothetical protein